MIPNLQGSLEPESSAEESVEPLDQEDLGVDVFLLEQVVGI